MKEERTRKLTDAPPRLSIDELHAMGKALRDKCPRHSHAAWKAPAGRPDPLRLLAHSNKGRIPELIPIRHGRMVRTPFTFYRGAALNMAADLAGTPATGLNVQACGDCHLLNFGAFATPERRLIFEINDLDETLPAPWEWDVKRLAASLVLASRNNGFSRGVAQDAVLSCVRSYRERMTEYGEMSVLDVWYSSIDTDVLATMVKDKDAKRRSRKRLDTARERSGREHDFPKLVVASGGSTTIKDSPPLMYHLDAAGEEDLMALTIEAYSNYRESLQEDRRVLLDRFELKDIAMKVVGVGSVGTFCAIMLLMAGERDHLLLQIKEARRSVLETYAGRSIYPHHGQRVVNGYRLLQPASDVFLGWTTGRSNRRFYIRQLKDMKVSPTVEVFTPGWMAEYAGFCGWALARAHARSGGSAQISGYLGKSDVFDQAIAAFAHAYADQDERDYAVFKKAVNSGRVKAVIDDA